MSLEAPKRRSPGERKGCNGTKGGDKPQNAIFHDQTLICNFSVTRA